MTPPAPGVSAHFQRVGAISVVADRISRRTYADSNAAAKAPAPETRGLAANTIDAAYADQIAAAIPAVTGAQAIRAPYDAADFALLNDPASPYIQPGFWDAARDPVGLGARAYCARNHLDAIVVASRLRDDDVLGGTIWPIEGAGIYLNGDRALLHLTARLSLIDCVTGRPLVHRQLGSGRVFAGSHGYPVREIPVDRAGKALGQWSPQDDAWVAQALIDLPASAWIDTLRTMVRPNDASRGAPDAAPPA